jgi:hypothetical protein
VAAARRRSPRLPALLLVVLVPSPVMTRAPLHDRVVVCGLGF